MSVNEFEPFPKLARLSREVVITEKLDGTNAQIYITQDGEVIAGSRNRWVTPENDNYGFARWVRDNRSELLTLGPGRHFGEWWGSGIQRSYGMKEKRFSLFNTNKWAGEKLPNGVYVVPVICSGIMSDSLVESAIDLLRNDGSIAAPGFPRPEGIVIYHTAAGISFKKTLEKDEAPKSCSQ